jgi:hypothetical protein
MECRPAAIRKKYADLSQAQVGRFNGAYALCESTCQYLWCNAWATRIGLLRPILREYDVLVLG